MRFSKLRKPASHKLHQSTAKPKQKITTAEHLILFRKGADTIEDSERTIVNGEREPMFDQYGMTKISYSRIFLKF